MLSQHICFIEIRVCLPVTMVAKMVAIVISGGQKDTN
jgi:hypothetical protein